LLGLAAFDRKVALGPGNREGKQVLVQRLRKQILLRRFLNEFAQEGYGFGVENHPYMIVFNNGNLCRRRRNA